MKMKKVERKERSKKEKKKRRLKESLESPSQERFKSKREVSREEQRFQFKKTNKTSPDYLRSICKTHELFPCESVNLSDEKSGLHLESNIILLNRMKHLTSQKKKCCWITCKAFVHCDLDNWGEQVTEREEAETKLHEMLSELVCGRGPWSPHEVSFLNDMCERMAMNDRFIPTERQQAWIDSLHDRWMERHLK